MYTNHVHQGHSPAPLQTNNIHTNHMPNGHSNPMPNGSAHQPPPNPRSNHHAQKGPITVMAIPSVTVENNQLVVGDSQSSSQRSYTPLKVVGDGSFGTVWLCDWHGTLPPNTPMSAMQCGAGARPEYAGKRLVAVKRMKRRWEGGWDECKKLKELESLRAIPYHPTIIPLYDFFLLPATKELYFVFESMEGNLYQLIKTRKGKPLAGGLVSSIFRQVVEGLDHIHGSGYFHRDMKPENLLVTTTGLHDYRPLSPTAPPNAPPERDVVAVIKLADFGLARETASSPPYTEYVSTRWYRAPEVLLKSRDYSNPVDMWALGTIMSELVNLRPLFPGQSEVDQVARICDLLGDPCEDYGVDERGRLIGGGKWSRGIRLARAVGFAFPKMEPKNFYSLFDPSVPMKLVDCIVDLLKYDPERRLTSSQCLVHPYLLETTPLNNPPGPPLSPVQIPPNGHAVYAKSSQQNGASSATSLPSVAPRVIPPSKVEFSPPQAPAVVQIPDASSSHRTSFYDSSSAYTTSISETSGSTSLYGEILHAERHPVGEQISATCAASSSGRAPWSPSYPHQPSQEWETIEAAARHEAEQYAVSRGQRMDIQTSPMVREHPTRPPDAEREQINSHSHVQEEVAQSQGNKLSKLGALGFGKKHSRWGLGMFGHGDKGTQHLPPVQEVNVASAGSTPSLKRTQSSSTDSRSLSELSPVNDLPSRPVMDPKQQKKEADRIARSIAREAEEQRRQLAKKAQREQARAVMEKNKRFLSQDPYGGQREWEWLSSFPAVLAQQGPQPPTDTKGKQPAAGGPIRQTQSHGTHSRTVNAAGGSFMQSTRSGEGSVMRSDWIRRPEERFAKARRRDLDDDHSMSSSDLQSGMSVISFATVDSDPGPNRGRNRSSAYDMGMGRMQSMSSLRTNSDMLGRSSGSLSLDQQLVNDFHLRASVDSSSISDGGSPPPPPMHMLSLSSPIPWQHPSHEASSDNIVESPTLLSRRQAEPSQSMSLSLPPQPLHPQGFQPSGPASPYEPSIYGHPPSPGVAPKSAINPIFKVPPLPLSVDTSSPVTSLPPFSHLEAVADGEYPPLSPMSFTSPEELVHDDES